MPTFLLFIFGAAFGSFLNVLILRYDGGRSLFSRRVLGGRSYCPRCGATLKWFELVPILSFVLQLGRCRHCRESISLEYPLVEILAGLIFVFVPLRLYPYFIHNSLFYILSFLWILVFLTLVAIFLIDIRLRIIPNEANIFLAILGFFIVWFSRSLFDLSRGSFLGPYALLFGWRGNIWSNHIFAALLACAFFGGLILVTRGRGMGIGDLKLAVPLGFIFGWPDIAIIVGLGFILGSLAGAYAVLLKKKSFKSLLPFGPFLAIASGAVFFFGKEFFEFYLKLAIF